MRLTTTTLTVAGIALAATGARAQDNDCSTIGFAPFENTAKPLGVCGGHGTCVDGRCVCDAGWTGRSDVVDMEGLDCHVNVAAVSGLWAFCLLAHVLILVKSLPRLRIRIKVHSEIKARRRRVGKKYALWQNRGLAACVLYFCLAWPSTFIYAVLRLAIPQQRLGIDVVPTILFCIAKVGFYGAVYAFQPALMASTLQNKQQTRHLVRLGDRLTFAACALAIFVGWAPIITLITGEKSGTSNVAVWYMFMGGTAAQLILFGGQARFIYFEVAKVLEKSYELNKDERVLKTRDALMDIQLTVVKQSQMQFLIYALFAFLPFLMGKHDYFLPIGWLGWLVIGKSLAFTQLGADQGTSSNANGSTDADLATSSANLEHDSAWSKAPAASESPAQNATSFADPHLSEFARQDDSDSADDGEV